MTSLICSVPNPLDATSLYRAIGPFQTLKRQLPSVDLMINPDMAWPVLKGADMAFFQRPFTPDRLEAIKMCRVNSKPVWVDYDDNLHAIPICNRKFPLYGNPQTQHTIATIIAMADVVTASTTHLAESMKTLLKCFPDQPEYHLNPNKIGVIPNAYDPELHPSLLAQKGIREKLIVWRGSDSHCKDLHVYTNAIADCMVDQEWTFEFVGEPFWLMIETLKKVSKTGRLIVTGAQDPVSFFKYLDKRSPALMIVPLEDIAFNRSKSNIAWIEATAAGAITLAPDWDEWRKPGVITYSDPLDFTLQVQAFMAGNFDVDKLWKESRDYILENLDLSKVNLGRAGIIGHLTGRVF
jgi:hypothetical protein